MAETKDVTQNKPDCVYYRNQNKVFITDTIQYDNVLIKFCIPRTIKTFRPQKELNVVEFVRIAIDIDSKSSTDIVSELKEMCSIKDTNIVRVTTDFAFLAERSLRLYERDSRISSELPYDVITNFIFSYNEIPDIMLELICLLERWDFTDESFILAKTWLAVAAQKHMLIRNARRFMCKVLRLSKDERQEQQNRIDLFQRWIDLTAEAEVKKALERTAMYLDHTTLTVDHIRHLMLSSRINDLMHLEELINEFELKNASSTQVFNLIESKYPELCCELILTNMQSSNPLTLYDDLSIYGRQTKHDVEKYTHLISTIDRRMLFDFEVFIKMYSSCRRENTSINPDFHGHVLRPINSYFRLLTYATKEDMHTYPSRLLDIERQKMKLDDSMGDSLLHYILNQAGVTGSEKIEPIVGMIDTYISNWLRSEQEQRISTETRQARVSHALRIKNRTSSFHEQQADTNGDTSLSDERSIKHEEHEGRKKSKKKRKHRQVNDSDTDSDIEPIDIAETKDETQNEVKCVYFRDQLHVFTTGTEMEHDGLHLNDMEVLKHRAIPETKSPKNKKKASSHSREPFFALSTESGSTDLSDDFHRPYEAEPDEDLF